MSRRKELVAYVRVSVDENDLVTDAAYNCRVITNPIEVGLARIELGDQIADEGLIAQIEVESGLNDVVGVAPVLDWGFADGRTIKNIRFWALVAETVEPVFPPGFAVSFYRMSPTPPETQTIPIV